MAERYRVGDQVEIFLGEKFGDRSGWYTGTVFKIDPYSEHRSFYWVNLDVAAQTVTGMRQISIFNLKNIRIV